VRLAGYGEHVVESHYGVGDTMVRIGAPERRLPGIPTPVVVMLFGSSADTRSTRATGRPQAAGPVSWSQARQRQNRKRAAHQDRTHRAQTMQRFCRCAGNVRAASAITIALVRPRHDVDDDDRAKRGQELRKCISGKTSLRDCLCHSTILRTRRGNKSREFAMGPGLRRDDEACHPERAKRGSQRHERPRFPRRVDRDWCWAFFFSPHESAETAEMKCFPLRFWRALR